jgi:hypothetical protein
MTPTALHQPEPSGPSEPLSRTPAATEPDALLDEIRAATAQLAAANALAAAAQDRRDRLILTAARAERPHPAIAAAADITVQMVGKLARGAGLRRYRPRGEVTA